MNKSTGLRAWTDINSLLRTHKLINFGLIILCLLQTVVIFTFYFGDPIVIVKSEGHEEYFSGQRGASSISESAVEDFVRSFLKVRYQWTELDPKTMKKNLAPMVTVGLGKKLFKLLVHLQDKEFQGKKTSQSIVNIQVSVTSEKVVASFDKLLKIDGIPIPVPTSVSLNIIKDTPNRWNPIGLLVNGIKEHQIK